MMLASLSDVLSVAVLVLGGMVVVLAVAIGGGDD